MIPAASRAAWSRLPNRVRVSRQSGSIDRSSVLDGKKGRDETPKSPDCLPVAMTDDEKAGTFLVTATDDDSAVLADVDDGQVHTLAENPGVDVGEAIEGTVAPEPPLDVAWRLVDVAERWPISVEESAESPTTLERDVAAEQAVGELTRRERAGVGEIHVLTVSESETASAVADVLDDEEGLRSRAARLGVERVVVRSEPGVVSVRYLP